MRGLGEMIREKREREGLSLRQAGEASGVAFSTLGRIENGGETTVKIAHKIEAWLSGKAPILPPPPMTLRDWFAGQALAGLLAYPDGGDPGQTIEQHTAHHAEIAYRYADAILAERAKEVSHAS